MSFPRLTPIYAWGEKPRPRRVMEEEHRRPPAEEEMVPVPAASPTIGEEGTDSLAVAREALEFAHSFGRNLRQVHKLLPLLAEVVGSLEEADHPKAQRLLDHLHFWLQRETSPAVAPKVAGHMLLLLDAAPQYLRAFGYTTFQTMLERGAERDPTVIEASWNILKKLASLVGHRKLEPLLQNQDESSVCLVMVKQFQKVPACHFLPQTISHLNSPHASTREAAVRMLGFIGMQTQDQRKLAVIHKALREVTSGQHLSVHSPALRTIDLLEALHEHVPARRNLREGLRWLFGPCCSSTEGV